MTASQAKKKKKKGSTAPSRPVATQSLVRISNPTQTLQANPLHWRQFQIFERLGQFKRLEILDLQRPEGSQASEFVHQHGNPSFSETSSLEIRLNRGVKSLGPVRELKEIRMMKTHQELLECDLEWLVQSFPKLMSLGSDLHPSPNKCGRLNQFVQVLLRGRRGT